MNDYEHDVEVEIKALIPEGKHLDVFAKIVELSLLGKKGYGGLSLIDNTPMFESQLNHYFMEGKRKNNLRECLSGIVGISDEALNRLSNILDNAVKFSIRTRWSSILFAPLMVIKASVQDSDNEESNANGVSRVELEIPFYGYTLEQLDNLILSAGFIYQAKWSRDRWTLKASFHGSPITYCLDKNSGYGYVLEIETMTNADDIEAALKQIRFILADLGLEELPSDRLKRMFEYYNTNWKKYYGKDKIFAVE